MTNNTWHYQLMRHKDEDGVPLFAIHEYYTLEDGDEWTEQPIFVDGESESMEEVKQVLQAMLEDIEKHGVKDYE